MKQTSLGLGTSTKRTRQRKFLDEMDRVVPWSDLVAQIAAFTLEGKRACPLFPMASLLRIHFMQQWFTLSDPAMEEALHDMPPFRDFAGLGGWDDRLPDGSTILRFRHVLEEHKLAERTQATINLQLGAKGLMLRSGTEVDATLTSAPSSTKNAVGERKLLDRADPMDALTEQAERMKASSQGGAPVPRHQASVRPQEGASPRPDQEHGATAHTVCTSQHVDSAQALERELGMSASSAWEMGAKRAQNTSGPANSQPAHVSTPDQGQRSFMQTLPSRPIEYVQIARGSHHQFQHN